MNDQLYSIIFIASALAVAWIIYGITALLLNGKLKEVRIGKLKIELRLIRRPLRLLIPALCLIIIYPFLRLPENILSYIFHFLKITVIFSMGWMAIKFVHIFRVAILDRYDITASNNLRARQVYTQTRMLENVVNILIIVVTISVMLMSFSKVREVGMSILASAGILGIIIGFAAQKTLGNLIAGIQLAITQPIRLDDVVIIENEWGRIEEINLTFVVVRIWDLRRLVVPLSYFMEKPFQNWTRTSADLLGTVFLYVDYTVNIDQLRDELTRILTDHPKWDKKVNLIQVTNTTERTVELRVLISASNSPNAWDLRCDIREKLLVYLQKNYPDSLPKVRLEMDQTQENSQQDQRG